MSKMIIEIGRGCAACGAIAFDRLIEPAPVGDLRQRIEDAYLLVARALVSISLTR